VPRATERPVQPDEHPSDGAELPNEFARAADLHAIDVQEVIAAARSQPCSHILTGGTADARRPMTAIEGSACRGTGSRARDRSPTAESTRAAGRRRGFRTGQGSDNRSCNRSSWSPGGRRRTSHGSAGGHLVAMSSLSVMGRRAVGWAPTRRSGVRRPRGQCPPTGRFAGPLSSGGFFGRPDDAVADAPVTEPGSRSQRVSRLGRATRTTRATRTARA